MSSHGTCNVNGLGEEWRLVVGHPRYEVSNLGRIRSPRGIVKSHLNESGYLKVLLSCGSRKDRVHRSVHSLVMEAFIGPRPDGSVIDHLNMDKTENRTANLDRHPELQAEVAAVAGMIAERMPAVKGAPVVWPKARTA